VPNRADAFFLSPAAQVGYFNLQLHLADAKLISKSWQTKTIDCDPSGQNRVYVAFLTF